MLKNLKLPPLMVAVHKLSISLHKAWRIYGRLTALPEHTSNCWYPKKGTTAEAWFSVSAKTAKNIC